MKIFYVILSTKNQVLRERYQQKTWLKNEKYLYLTDEGGINKLRCTDNSSYSSNEEKQIVGINYLIDNINNFDYDWFYFCDNDTYVFTDNLKNKLKQCDEKKVWGYILNKDKDPENPIFVKYGENFKYCSGGAGFCISKKLLSTLPKFFNQNTTYADVSVGVNLNNYYIPIDELIGCHPQKYTNYKDLDGSPVSYHYIKDFSDYLYLYQYKRSYDVVSFSLWGNKEKYRYGAIKNIELAKTYYPGWKLRFYINDTIEMDFAKKLHDSGCQVFKIQNPGGKSLGSFEGMYWRFNVNDDLLVRRFCIRDADSRFNSKEAAAVEDWISSGLPFHTMRDHPNHAFPIQGGLWGGKTGIINNMAELITKWNQYDKYSCDQFFLANVIYPNIKDMLKVHCTYRDKKPFPPHTPLPEGEFVGQVFDEFNKGYPE